MTIDEELDLLFLQARGLKARLEALNKERARIAGDYLAIRREQAALHERVLRLRAQHGRGATISARYACEICGREVIQSEDASDPDAWGHPETVNWVHEASDGKPCPGMARRIR